MTNVRHGKNAAASAVVAVLLVIVGLLAFAVDRRMSTTAVAEQVIAPPPAPVSTPEVPTTEAPIAVFIGDFTKGTDEGGLGDNNWTSILVANAGKAMPLRSAVVGEGSGYVIRSGAPTFADQVRRYVTPEDHVVVISGSRNDVVADPKEVTVAAMETFALVHTLAPGANLVVVGPTWGSAEPSQDVLNTRDAVQQAALSASAYFVDPIELRWFTTGEPGLIGADNVHPTDLANQRIAEYMMPTFSRALVESNSQ